MEKGRYVLLVALSVLATSTLSQGMACYVLMVYLLINVCITDVDLRFKILELSYMKVIITVWSKMTIDLFQHKQYKYAF